MFLREAGDAEDAAVNELGCEDDLVIFTGFGAQRKHDVEIAVRKRIGVDVDADVDGRCLVAGLQRTRRARILEGKILGVLGQDVKRGGLRVVVCHWGFLEA